MCKRKSLAKMVASPVSDLLTPKFHARYIEYKNTNGDTLIFKTCLKDGVKMVSLNGIDIYLDELNDIIQDVEGKAFEDDEDDKQNECDIILPCILTMAIIFVAAMFYMRYVFSIAF